jgi:ADP-heptose:LPS heptosyltransferase
VNEPTSKPDLGAVISFEDHPEKLRSCIKALASWVPQITVLFSSESDSAKQIAQALNVSTYVCSASHTQDRWDIGLTQISAQWVLLMRSNEIVTGQLRKSIVEQTATRKDAPYQCLLPRTMVFLKKRLKYPLDWSDATPSRLIHLPPDGSITSIDSLPQKKIHLDGELIRYSEGTLSECTRRITEKAKERSDHLTNYLQNISFWNLIFRGTASAVIRFSQIYFLRKGFKEGFEGAMFSLLDSAAEFLGYLRYYEYYVRGGKLLQNNLGSLNHILVIKLRDIGDNILATPLIRNLKQHLPQASISVLTWSYSLPVFEGNPHVHRLFGISKNPSPSEINTLIDELNSIKFDLVMNTHGGSLSSALLSQVKTKNRIHNFYRGRNKIYNILTGESDYYRSSIERDLDCMRSLSLEPVNTKTEVFLTPEETCWARRELENKGLDPSKKLILVHPTAGGATPIKEWPIKRFSELIKKLNADKNIQTLVICTGKEFSRIQSLTTDIPGLVILHMLTLRQMMAIVKECDLIIDNDSAPSHIATAFGIPAIVLFGPGIREIFRPYDPAKDHHFVFYNDVYCRDCELTHCDNRICLDFASDEVHAKALEMISNENKGEKP